MLAKWDVIIVYLIVDLMGKYVNSYFKRRT